MSDFPIKTAFVAANGLTFEVDQCGTGDKFALLLHGFPESNFSWRYQMPLLAKLGYTVWAPNMRGYGKTSRPPAIADYHIDHLVADTAALIDAAGAKNTLLMARLGRNRCVAIRNPQDTAFGSARDHERAASGVLRSGIADVGAAQEILVRVFLPNPVVA